MLNRVFKVHEGGCFLLFFAQKEQIESGSFVLCSNQSLFFKPEVVRE
jgi:hypothetical protein